MGEKHEKWGILLWIFAGGREILRVMWGLLVSNRASFEGRRGGSKGQGAEVVQLGVDEGGNVESKHYNIGG